MSSASAEWAGSISRLLMSSERSSLAFRDCVVAALLLAWPLAWLAEALVTRTHHRPLGAATFASFCVVAFLLTALLPARLRAANSRRLVGRVPVEHAPSGKAPAERVLWALGAASLIATAVRGFAT
jgi:hypothetical protein